MCLLLCFSCNCYYTGEAACVCEFTSFTLVMPFQKLISALPPSSADFSPLVLFFRQPIIHSISGAWNVSVVLFVARAHIQNSRRWENPSDLQTQILSSGQEWTLSQNVSRNKKHLCSAETHFSNPHGMVCLRYQSRLCLFSHLCLCDKQIVAISLWVWEGNCGFFFLHSSGDNKGRRGVHAGEELWHQRWKQVLGLTCACS